MKEIFASIQGESSWAGRPCTFVRLAGCDLRCRWCDSEYTFTGGETHTIDQILAQVEHLKIPLVEITGGEPLLQKGTRELCRVLLAKGYQVLIETGGHHPIDVLPPDVIKIVDVKCPGSGHADRNHDSVLTSLSPRDEVKFVLADRADYEWARPRAIELAPRVKDVLFSPVWGELEPAQLADWILADSLPVRLNLQQHKILWGDTPGR